MRARETESKGADPVRVFLILAAILVAIGAVFWLTRSDPIADTPANATSPNESPDFSLTNEEAIARFKELDRLRVRLLRHRDSSLLREIFVPGSPAETRLVKSLSVLRDEQTLYRSESTNESVRVTENTPERLKVEQVVTVRPKFVSESGEDVTAGRDERQTIVWELQPFDAEWLLFDGLLTDVEKI